MSAYVKLGLEALMPVVAAVVLFLLERKTRYGNVPYIVRQVVAGVIFGAIAIFGTEYGIPITGAVVNARDGAVLTAGLVFGGPAGIIAGLLGGIERWIAVNWGVGSFTRVACSVSTALAGFYAAAVKKYLFNNKKPNWGMSFVIGFVMEIFHMSMVFITNLNESDRAMQVLKICTIPMVAANSLSVLFAALAIAAIVGEDIRLRKKEKKKISDTIQKWLLVVIVVAFLFTGAFVFKLQDTSAKNAAQKFLSLAVEDTIADVEDATNRGLFDIAREIDTLLDEEDLFTLAFNYDVAEINQVNKSGIIVNSNVLSQKGYNMLNGSQSAEFMRLLNGKVTEFAQSFQATSIDSDVGRKYVGIANDEGFLQIGLDRISFQEKVENEIIYAAKNKHVGNDGYIVIGNILRQVVSAPSDLEADTFKDLSPAFENRFQKIDYNTMFKAVINGVPSYCWAEEAEGFTVLAVMSEEEVLQTRNIAVYANTFMQVLIFAVLFALVYLLIVKVVVNQITKVNRSLYRIRHGNLNEVVNVKDSYEFAYLSDDINATVDTLKHYIDEAAARIDADLKMAKDIQASALPNIFPAFPQRTDFDIYARMDTAKEVGGDFYDYYMTDSSHLHLLIADVSGKGIPAAMFMMRAKTQLASLTKSGIPINEVFSKGSDALCEGNDAGMFVTAWQGGINLDTGLVKFANGGHNPPLIKKANGKFEYLKSRVNLVLAGMEGAPYIEQELNIEVGDTIFLYTDGVTEATDANNQLYGEDRLQDLLNSREFKDMKDLCDSVKADVDKFVGEAPQFDDITMVAFKYIGQEKQIDDLNITVPSKIENNTQIIESIEEYLDMSGCPMKAKMQIIVAVDEIITNIASYAYKGSSLPEDEQKTMVKASSNGREVKICFADSGTPYNPLEHEDPDITLSLEERGIGGLGILMVKKTMDEVSYAYEDGQNRLILTKKYTA